MDGHGMTKNFDAADALLSDLAARDIRLKLVEGRLGYDAPTGAFTDALKERVRALRPALIARLETPPATVAPLSSGQERMWFLNQLEGGSGGYTEHLAFSLDGPLDRAALDGALSAVAARHGALRTRFRDGPQGPEQVVAPPAPLPLAVQDLSATPGALDAALERAAHRAVDLASDPPVAFALFALGAERHVLSVSAHHAAWDGWSNGLFTADLAAAYNALRAGHAPNLPPLARDVAELARTQRADLAGGALDAALERLRRTLEGYPTLLELPTDRPRAAIADGRGAALTLRIEPTDAAALAAAGRRAGATPYMTVLAGWALLLARLAGVPRLLIGAPVAAREGVDEEAVIGYLSNTIAVPVDVGAAPSFGALVAQVRDRVLEAMATQRVPFEKLVEALAPPRSRATTPLVQAVFAMQPRTVPAPALDGLTVTVLPRHNEAARYELMLNLETTADGALEGPLTYATALFDRATLSDWADALLATLRAAPAAWDAPLDRSPIPRPAHSATPRDGGAFATPTERALAAIWAEFLQTPPTRRDDDFFVLGGHSLLLMRVVNRVNGGGLGRIALADALGATVLSAMAALIDGGAVSPAAASVVADPGNQAEEHPASAGQEGMWLTRRDDPASVTWLVPLSIPLPRHADPAVVRTALERLSARHPALRATLVERDGAVVQRIAPPGPVPLTVHQGLDADARRAVMRAELARPMELSQGSLYRFHLFRDGTGRAARCSWSPTTP